MDLFTNAAISMNVDRSVGDTSSRHTSKATPNLRTSFALYEPTPSKPGKNSNTGLPEDVTSVSLPSPSSRKILTVRDADQNTASWDTVAEVVVVAPLTAAAAVATAASWDDDDVAKCADDRCSNLKTGNRRPCTMTALARSRTVVCIIIRTQNAKRKRTIVAT